MAYADSFENAARDYWTPDPGAGEIAAGEDPDPGEDPGAFYPSWTGPDPDSLGRPDRCYACGRADGRTLCGGLLCHDCLEGTPDGIALPF